MHFEKVPHIFDSTNICGISVLFRTHFQHFPFATANPMKDLAKFYRDCFNAPPLQAFAEPLPPLVLNGDAVNMAAAEEIIEAEEKNEANDAMTKLLEQFETSLPDYETLVTSLTNRSTDKNSNS